MLIMNNIYDWKKIGQRIKEERKKIKLSQQELADRKTIANWENGITKPQLEDMISLCNLFQCELGYLLAEPDYNCKSQGTSYIQEVTGLSEESIDSLKCLYNNSPKAESYKLSHAAVDLILKEEENSCFLWDIGMYLFGKYVNGRAKEQSMKVGVNPDNTLVHTVPLLNENSGKEWFFDIKDLKEALLLKITHRLQNWKDMAEKEL
jgi:transcriptional regulator with XRE-family HTH domain